MDLLNPMLYIEYPPSTPTKKRPLNSPPTLIVFLHAPPLILAFMVLVSSLLKEKRLRVYMQ